ncbi:hypothetical protein [Cytobacillus kochii]|uniref:hypothetical protein n=1 Tax=Cytobacillus kochii TaxID=859143 RepID=UPI0025A10BEE|nr:hypothetical protein [Cytobacillus kochii]MDM5209215.1 hypothetical protein [Cytobacillus kochii]
MEEFIIKNSGYASENLIDVFKDYSSSVGVIEKVISERFTKTVVKDYNKLKKELKMKYKKSELRTGNPEVLKEISYKLKVNSLENIAWDLYVAKGNIEVSS